MRHAMLMCVHSNFNILQRFLDLYDDERYDYYILIDKKNPIKDEEVIKRYPTKSKVFFVPRIKISWAGHSQIEANMLLYEYSSKGNYDYYHFLQGSDFPVKTADYVDAFFEKNAGKEFVNIYYTDFAKIKCGYYHFFTNNHWFRTNLFVKALNKTSLFIQKLLHVNRNSDLELYSGSALTSLTHECVTYLLDRKEEISRRFKYTLAADEVFLQTMIYNSLFREKIYKFERTYNANVRFIDLSRKDGNPPYTLFVSDFDELISADEDVCFARKFIESADMEIIEKLYDYLKKQ